MASENTVSREVRRDIGHDSRLFRINTGMGWVSGGKPAYRSPDGNVIVPYGRPVSLGLTLINNQPLVGTTDLVGAHRVKITPEMVGKTIAVVLCVETKKTGGGKQSEKQKQFIATVQAFGGIAGFADSSGSANKIIDDWLAFINS